MPTEPTRLQHAVGTALGAGLVLTLVAFVAAPVAHTLVILWRWAL